MEACPQWLEWEGFASVWNGSTAKIKYVTLICCLTGSGVNLCGIP